MSSEPAREKSRFRDLMHRPTPRTGAMLGDDGGREAVVWTSALATNVDLRTIPTATAFREVVLG